MVEKKFIIPVDESMGRAFNMNNFYRFHMDRDDIADNMIKKWKDPVGDPLQVSINLVNLATEMYQQAMVEDEEENEDDEGSDDENDCNTIDPEAALKSSEYKTYINAVAELEKIQLYGLPEYTRKAILLNCYQCMYVHHFLKKLKEEAQQDQDDGNANQGYLGSLKQYMFSFSPKPFYYNIGGENLSLEEMKHGLLRNNVKAPMFYMRSMSSNDQRLNLLKNHWDPRINFVCLDYATFLEHIDPIEGSS